MNRPKVKCPCCDGTGKVLLPLCDWETLRALDRLGKATAEKIKAQLPDEITSGAYSNRLKRLLHLGYVTRRRQGKYWIYAIAK